MEKFHFTDAVTGRLFLRLNTVGVHRPFIPCIRIFKSNLITLRLPCPQIIIRIFICGFCLDLNLRFLRGFRFRRRHWNGRALFILQRPKNIRILFQCLPDTFLHGKRSVYGLFFFHFHRIPVSRPFRFLSPGILRNCILFCRKHIDLF